MSKLLPALELAARWYVWAKISIYGLGKMLGGQFYRRGRLPEEIAALPLGEAAGFPLAWTFFGYSTAYIAFIGLAQLVGGLLLLFERTKLLGMAILLPVLLNIVVVDVIYGIPGGALFSALLYLLLLLFVAAYNRQRVFEAFQALTRPPRQRFFGSGWWPRLAIVVALLALLLVAEGLVLRGGGG